MDEIRETNQVTTVAEQEEETPFESPLPSEKDQLIDQMLVEKQMNTLELNKELLDAE
jgi:hypothetical protein